MAATFLDIAITPDVMDVQHEMGSDSLWQTPRSRRQADRFGDSEAAASTLLPAICAAATGPACF